MPPLQLVVAVVLSWGLKQSSMCSGVGALIGLPRIKQLALRDIRASIVSGSPFPHTGLFGPGGLGKTQLARSIAYDLKYHYVMIEGAAIQNRRILVELLKTASDAASLSGKKLFFFVDEAHRLGAMQEVLYLPMSDGLVTTVGGTINFPPFTLVAATTHPNKLLKSFLRRLQNRWTLSRYNDLHIRRMVASWFDKQGMSFEPQSVVAIAQRSLGSPSQALDTLCSKVRNEALAAGDSSISVKHCLRTFELEGIDGLGLTEMHRRYLGELYAQGVPKGLSAIAGRLGEDEDVISGSVEPDLLSLGLIDLTGRGRVLTERGRHHLRQTRRG